MEMGGGWERVWGVAGLEEEKQRREVPGEEGAPCLQPGRRGRRGHPWGGGEGPPPGLDLPGPRAAGTLLPLAGGVGRRVPVTTSPRLELELSPDLLRGRSGERETEG